MTYLVVIDTNVLVSSLLSKHSNASTFQVVDAIFSRTILPVYNNTILQEYDEVLHRPKYKFPENSIQTLLRVIQANGILSEQITSNISLPDPKDLVFYEVVLSKQNKNAYLVTGNIKHFPNTPFIVTPNELLKIINTT